MAQCRNTYREQYEKKIFYLLHCLKNWSGGYFIIMNKVKYVLHRYVMTGEREWKWVIL